MYRTTGLPNIRIDVADALRGIAVTGIILIHACEHFNLYWSGFAFDRAVVASLEKPVADAMWWLFAGKMYTIFAMLFGLSFYIQNDNQVQRGRDFTARFTWRMVLLFCIGLVNTAFYNGDVLVLYSMLGLLMPWLGRLPTRYLWIICGVLLAQPLEIYQHLTGVSFQIDASTWGNAANVAYTQGNVCETFGANLHYGQLTCLSWYWNYGRVTQTLGMFVLGLLLGRSRLFYNEGNNLRIWGRIVVCSVLIAAALFTASGKFESPVQIVFSSWYNLAQTLGVVSGVVLLWYAFRSFRKVVGNFGIIGRMSLTNYLLQSLLGTLVFYHCGLGLYAKVGMVYGLLVGVGIVVAQYIFSRWWLQHFDHGPVEWLWKRLTWIGSKR